MTKHRPIFAIAKDIQAAWPKPFFAAVPYLSAMHHLATLQSMYGAEDARSIVLYFLSNAGTFRGPQAKALKAELKALL